MTTSLKLTENLERRVALGSLCTLNPPEEVELAERLCAIHPWAQQARLPGDFAILQIPAACELFSEDFSNPNLPGWNTANATWRVVDGKLQVSSIQNPNIVATARR